MISWTYIDLSSKESKTKQFPSIDVTKLLCSILVVAIHTNPLRSINKYLDYGLVEYLARLAVPFFFVATGYLCFRKTTRYDFDKRIPMAYAKKVFILYIIWNGIYIPQICYNAYINENGIFSIIPMLLFKGYHHLWYLLATAIAIMVLTIAIHNKVRFKYILMFGSVLYIIGLLGQSYFALLSPLKGTILWEVFKLYEKIFFTTRNGIFEGILFVGMGALFAYKKVEIKKNVAIGGFIISMFLLLIESFLVKYFELLRASDLYLFLVPATFFMFYLVAHMEISECVFTQKARIYSSLIYFTHAWINFPIICIIVKCVEELRGGEYVMHSLVRFGIVAGGAITVSYMMILLQNLKGFKWIRKLY